MRFSFLCDETDFKFAHWNARMTAVDAGVHPRACLQLQNVFFLVKCPNARQGRIQVLNHRITTALQHLSQAVGIRKCRADGCDKLSERAALGKILVGFG